MGVAFGPMNIQYGSFICLLKVMGTVSHFCVAAGIGSWLIAGVNKRV